MIEEKIDRLAGVIEDLIECNILLINQLSTQEDNKEKPEKYKQPDSETKEELMQSMRDSSEKSKKAMKEQKKIKDNAYSETQEYCQDLVNRGILTGIQVRNEIQSLGFESLSQLDAAKMKELKSKLVILAGLKD